MERVQITLEICGESQPAQIAADLTIAAFLEEIQREFEAEIRREYPHASEFYVWRKDGVNPLAVERTFREIGSNSLIVFGDVPPRTKPFRLYPDWLAKERSQLLPPSSFVQLTDMTTRRHLNWRHVPVIIGREGKDIEHKVEKIVVVHSEDSSVSREHAAIIESNGVYYIVPLKETPTWLNDLLLQPNIAYPLENDDLIRLGTQGNVLSFNQAKM